MAGISNTLTRRCQELNALNRKFFALGSSQRGHKQDKDHDPDRNQSAGHLKLGDCVTLTAQSGVMDDVPEGEKWMGTPAQPDLAAKRQIVASRQLPGLFKRVKALEKKLGLKPKD